MTMTIAEVEVADLKGPLRVTFAGYTDRGYPLGDSNELYLDFFSPLPEGWLAEEVGVVETRTHDRLFAWEVSTGDVKIVAVQHETGLELILLGAAANLVSEAAVLLVKWAWNRWKGRRRDRSNPMPPASCVIEVPGTAAASAQVRFVLAPSASDTEIVRYMRLAAELARTSAT